MFFISRALSTTAVRIAEGRTTCVKGKLTRQTLRELGDICGIFNISSGEIWLAGNGRISFSAKIPKEAHQRLRNCMAQSPYR